MNSEVKKMLKEKGITRQPRVLLAAAECAPLSKTGGLADVVGTLPKALAKLGFDARIITPYHRVIKDKYAKDVEHLFHFYADLGWRHEYVGIEKLELDGVIVYLVDSERYFGGKIYLGGYEEGEQYSFFCRSVLDALPNIGFEPDVIHCNDWHTAMLPMLAKTQYKNAMQSRPGFLITIHNIAFQGKYDFGFVKDILGVADEYYNDDYLELFGCADYLKAGCVFSDWINTVSPNYAEEIKTAYFGEGLDGVLSFRSQRLSGIINGIDTKVFNPGTDKAIPARYSSKNLKGKSKCKAELQSRMGLEVNPNVPLFSMVTRMTEQKGFNLVLESIDNLLNSSDMQLMVLGSGDSSFENQLRGVQSRYPGRVCAYIGYNEDLAHLVYAGSDFYLMPSRFEPCGLSQMIAMRYGSVPIVRETGGLKDTVIPYNCFTGEGTGFTFANYSADEMMGAVRYALECWKKPEVMQGLVQSCLNSNFSFDASALEYARLYARIAPEN